MAFFIACGRCHIIAVQGGQVAVIAFADGNRCAFKRHFYTVQKVFPGLNFPKKVLASGGDDHIAGGRIFTHSVTAVGQLRPGANRQETDAKTNGNFDLEYLAIFLVADQF